MISLSRKQKKNLQSLILLLIINLLLASCTSTKMDNQDDVTLQFCTFNGGENFQWDQKILDKFMELHPHIKVKNLYAPWGSYTEKVLVLTVGGISPDVLWTISGDLPFYASRNVIMDLTDLVYKDPSIDTSKYFPNALNLCSYKGRLFALPRDVCCLFYVYNKDMFDKDKVSYPDTQWTWDDFLAITKKLTKTQNGRIVQFGTGSGSGVAYYWDDVVHENNAAPLSPDGRESWVTRPEFYEPIQWWLNLYLIHHVAPSSSEASGFGGDLFQNGKVATSMTGPWIFTGYKRDLKFRYDIVNIPRGKYGNKVSLLGLPIAISKYTKHPKEAYELLKFLTYSDIAQTMQAQMGIGMPSRKDIAMSDVYLKQPVIPEHVNLYMKSMLEYTYVPDSLPYAKQIYDQINAGIELAQLGKMSVKDAMQLKQPIIQKIINKSIKKGEL